MKDKVSVIIPIYKAEKYLDKCIESVVNQTYDNLEIILINDASPDKCSEICEKWQKQDERIIILNNEKNSGVAQTRNNGLDIATGKYISFIDSDDVWHLEKIEKQLKFMKENNSKLSYTQIRFIDDDGNFTGKTFKPPKEVNYKKLFKQNVITLSSVMIEKETLNGRRFHDDHLHEDFIMWLEILRDELDSAYCIEDVLVDYRLTNGSKTRNKWKSLKMTYKTYKHFKVNWIKAHWYLMFYIIRSLKKYR